MAAKWAGCDVLAERLLGFNNNKTAAGVRCGGYGAAAGGPTARQQLRVPSTAL